jgi:hypothetical protein
MYLEAFAPLILIGCYETHAKNKLYDISNYQFCQVVLKVQIHDEIFPCNFGLMIKKFHEQLAGDNILCYNVSVFHVSHECFHN